MRLLSSAQPSLVVVDGNEGELTRTVWELRRRYGSDWRIVAERSGLGALTSLETMMARGDAVAVVLADQWLPDLTGRSYFRECVTFIRMPSGGGWSEMGSLG